MVTPASALYCPADTEGSVMNPNPNPVAPAAFVAADFRTYYRPTMNAFAAAEQNGKAAELQQELESLFEHQNASKVNSESVIPATFLRVTVTV
jgi:hypothetical protein